MNLLPISERGGLAMKTHNLYRFIKSIMDKGESPEITLDAIESVFGGALHHQPMYFPWPGWPAPGNATEDFHQWLEVQGWGTIQDVRDGRTLRIIPLAGPG